MPSAQEQYDEAMFAYSTGDYGTAIAALKAMLGADPGHFEAQLALGMAYYRVGDFAAAIAEGHKAESLRPQEQLVHTNLSLFYMKAGDKPKAEHHGLQARIASWRGQMSPPPEAKQSGDSDLELAKPAPGPAVKRAPRLPDMPWKKKPAADTPAGKPKDPL